jgi:membrane protein
MELPAVLTRFLDRPTVAVIRAVFATCGQAPGGLLANGRAFAALFTIFPVALVTLGVAGWLVDDPAVQAQLADAIAALVPPLADFIDQALSAMSEAAALSSVLGVVGLIWTVSQLYVTLDLAFSRIFPDRPERDLLRRTARGFVWVAGLVGTVIALIVGASLAAIAETLLPASATAVTAFGRIVSSPPVIVAFGVLIVVLIYRVVPPHSPSWRAIWLPGVVAGTAIVALSQLFAFLAPRIVGAASLAGPLATAFIALAWLSFTFQVLLLGASWVRVRDRGLTDGVLSALPTPATTTEPGGRGE